MIFGVAGKEIPFAVNFLPSRAGLSTVGYTVVDKDHNVIIARTQLGVDEIQFGSNPTGLYTLSLEFSNEFTGFIIWDTGQSPTGTGTDKLRVVSEEIFITTAVAGAGGATPADVTAAKNEILDAVLAGYDENAMKIPNTTLPAQIRVVRKHHSDPDWTTPFSDRTIHIDRNVSSLRVGGPPV